MGSSPEPRKNGGEVLLGKYQLGRLLGRGTFAKVYYCRSLSDGSGVAIKVLDKPEVVSSGMAPRLLREVEAMRRLSHPNILHLHEVMATRSKVYLVMELAPGGDLLSRVAQRGRLPEPAARRYFQQLLSALRFCHARGVAHRDLKPQNLLLDLHGALKVSDFGLSALPDQLAADGRLRTACGTPAYAAPEVLRGKPYDGPAADAWSCGVILYVLLAGSLPFDDSNLALMYRRIQRREYTFPPWFPPPAKRVVARLLDPNPESRMTLEKAVGLPWFTRSYSLDQRLSLTDVPSRDGQFDCIKSVSTPVMNAFDIISMSSGLDLSGLFDGGGRRREAKFVSTASVERIVDRIKETGTRLGYKVEWKKVAAGVAGELKLAMVVEVSIVASQLLLVELRIEGGGGGADDDQRFCWGSLKTELEDIVFAWHNNGDECL